MEIKGNNIYSAEEEQLAIYLRERNLGCVNDESDCVTPRSSFYVRHGKRIVDLVVIVPSIAILFPVMLALCVANLVDMGLPIFYRQTRIGLGGRPFDMVKYRSMRNARDEDGRELPGEKRLTKYGRFIRKTSLDELGNFFNILKGDMSIIGPRPMPTFVCDRMSERHKMRDSVRPGLECPRMIPLDEDKVGEYHLQFENDVWYVENISLLTDARMVLALVKMALQSYRRTYHAGVGTFFVGYNDEGVGLSLRLAREQYQEEYEAICAGATAEELLARDSGSPNTTA